MQILLAPTEELILGEKTYLSADEAASQTTLSVENSLGFSANDYIVLDVLGNDIAELLQISTCTSSGQNAITIKTATKFAHDSGAPIRRLKYNQRKFYRSADAITYTELTSEGSPVTIHVDDPEGTRLEDSTGTSAYYYKVTYYNSTTLIETLLADSIAEKGNDTSHYTSIYKIKKEAGFADNSYISSEEVSKYRDWAEGKAESAVATIYSLPFSSTPAIFPQIVTLLAAGSLLLEEYGVENDVDTTKNGQKKIDFAEKMLQDIADGKMLLLDSSKIELSRLSSNKASSSNIYTSGIADKGEMFNLSDERFQFTDPTDPTASSRI